MKSLPNTYILSPILHKDEVQVTPDIKLAIDKSYTNNLRDRNPQLGVVEAICEEDNPLALKVGDIVACNHFTFYGDIGVNRSFQLQPHVEFDGKLLFKVNPYSIFFKYNSPQQPEPLGDIVICTGVAEKDILGFDPNQGTFFHNSEFVQRGTVLAGGGFESGDEILTLSNSMYLIELDRTDYWKCRRNEVVAVVRDGTPYPTSGNIVIEYLPDEYQNGYSPLLVGTGVHISNNVGARVVSVADTYSNDPILIWKGGENFGWKAAPEVGDTVQAYRGQGVPFGNYWIVNKDNLCYGYETT